jgi:hypothetical protein
VSRALRGSGGDLAAGASEETDMTKVSRTTKARSRRVRKEAAAPPAPPTKPARTTKLDLLAALLARRDGATIADMMSATGWQPHSVRGALAGSLRRRGLAITSEKVDGVRRYKSGPAR